MKRSVDQIPQEDVRRVIRSYMAEQGLTMVGLAKKLGCKTPQTIYNYMSSINFTVNTLRKWSEALGYPFELLVKGLPYSVDKPSPTIEERLVSVEEKLSQLEALLTKHNIS